MKKLIGSKIRAARRTAGYNSQSDFAVALDVDQSRISRWESGSETPDPKFRKKLADFFGVTEKYLFDIEEVPEAHLTAKSVFEYVRRLEWDIQGFLSDPEYQALKQSVIQKQQEIEGLKKEIAAARGDSQIKQELIAAVLDGDDNLARVLFRTIQSVNLERGNKRESGPQRRKR